MPFIVLLVAGGATALALPPWAQLWTPVPGFGILLAALWKLEALQWQRGFVHGLCFGFGYFTVALAWISNAFYVNAGETLWMMPFAVGGLALFLSLYWAAAAAVTARFATEALRWLVLGISLALAEWLRGHLFTGFPWAAPGLMTDGVSAVEQAAAWLGMPGLTLLVVLWALAPAALVLAWWQRKRLDTMAVLVLLLLPVLWLAGSARLAEPVIVAEGAPTVRLVQPNIAQDDKWRDENKRAIFEQLIAISSRQPPVALTVWPESSVSFFLDETPEALARIADAIGPEGQLLAGAIRRGPGPPETQPYYTSVMHVDGAGQVAGTYDKWRLVPGGEFLPFDGLLSRLGFRKVVALPESFTAGPGPGGIDLPGIGLAGTSICYEAIFPDRLVGAARPRVLVNVTNDGWFGLSAGPHQHLAQARMRAVEQGLPLLRAANTGVSAIIDPYGRISAQTILGEAAGLTGTIPAALAPTFYAIWGDWIFALTLAFCLIFGAICLYIERLWKTA
ncbi:MAG: apolipoprotein N-acyltransferase [Hyphomicrobiales bacterium]